MRTSILLLGTALTLAAGLPLPAQQGVSTFFTGVNPRNITMTPIDTSKATRAFDFSKSFRTPTQTKTFNLSNVFPKIHLPTWPPIVPSTPVLGKSQNPFQPNALAGRNPFEVKPAK